MTLERWIALAILIVFVAYGYSALFAMDELLPPILKRNPVWPSSFPKIIAIGGVLISLVVLLNLEKSTEPKKSELDFTKLHEYKLGQAFILIAMMVIYALVLRGFGFIAATSLFIFGGSFVLGERRYILMTVVSLIASIGVWALVDSVLGIYLIPYPAWLGF